jgi:hypothetical protein
MTTTGRFTFTTTMWVIHRVHNHTADFWSASKPARTPSFSETHKVVVLVSNDSNGSVARFVDLANFPGRKLDDDVFLITTRYSCKCTPEY